MAKLGLGPFEATCITSYHNCSPASSELDGEDSVTLVSAGRPNMDFNLVRKDEFLIGIHNEDCPQGPHKY